MGQKKVVDLVLYMLKKQTEYFVTASGTQTTRDENAELQSAYNNV